MSRRSRTPSGVALFLGPAPRRRAAPCGLDAPCAPVAPAAETRPSQVRASGARSGRTAQDRSRGRVPGRPAGDGSLLLPAQGPRGEAEGEGWRARARRPGPREGSLRFAPLLGGALRSARGLYQYAAAAPAFTDSGRRRPPSTPRWPRPRRTAPARPPRRVRARGRPGPRRSPDGYPAPPGPATAACGYLRRLLGDGGH